MLRVFWCAEEERRSPWTNCRPTKESAVVGS